VFNVKRCNSDDDDDDDEWWWWLLPPVKCVSVCLYVCCIITFKSVDVESSFWSLGMSSGGRGQAHIWSLVRVKVIGHSSKKV